MLLCPQCWRVLEMLIFFFFKFTPLWWKLPFYSFPQAKEKKPPPRLHSTVNGLSYLHEGNSVSWELGHWQSRLLIAVIWDILSVSMSTLNPRNCSVPIWLSIFHALRRAVKYKLQVTYTITQRVLLMSLFLTTAVEEVKPGWKYGTTCLWCRI